MVGRDDELARLLEAFDRAAAGEAQVALVTGEAGIGKTRLVREFVSRLPEDTLVAFGHAVPMSGEAIPYGVAADLLRSLVREVETKRVTDILGDRIVALAPLVPRLGDGTERPIDRLALFAATQDLLADLGSEREVVLVVEDGHWIDDGSLDLLAFWARTLIRGRLMFVTTMRGTDLTPERLSRIDDLRRSFVDVSLTSLTDDDIAAQVRSVRPDADPAEISDVQRLSQGVPLFVEELAEHSEGARSTTVRAYLAARLHSLDGQHARMLEVAAHEPRPFSAQDLAVVAGVDPGSAETAIDAAANSRLLEPAGPRWRFRHELLRLAAVEATTPSGRVAAHRAWAGHLGDSSLADDLVAAADHQEALGVSPEYLAARIRAAEAVWRRGDNAAGRTQWLQALDAVCQLPPTDHGDELDLIMGALGCVAVTWQDVRDKILDRAPAPPDSLRAWQLRLMRYAASVWGERVESSTPTPEELRRAHARLERESPSLLAYTTAFSLLQCLWILRDYDGMRAMIPVAEALSLGLPEQFTHASVAAAEWRMITLVGLEAEPARRTLVEENLRACEGLDTRSRVWALVTAASELANEGDFRGVMRHVDLGLSLVPDVDVDPFWYLVAIRASNASLVLGDWERVLELGTVVASAGDRAHRRELIWHAGLVHAHRGDPAALETARWLREDMAAARPAPYDVADVLEAEMLVPHDPARARELVARHVGRPESTLFDPTNGPWEGPSWGFAAMLAWRGGSTDQAYCDRVDRDSDEGLAGSSLGVAWRREVEAHLARACHRDSVEQWQEVVVRWDEMGASYQAAQDRLRIAELLLPAGDRGTAAEALGSALTAAEALGARPLADEVRALAARARLVLPGHEPAEGETGPLTAREHEVLQLLVQGMTNDQIGSALFMSPRTASVHVSHILQKLGAANRTEVAAVAHRRGLVTGEG